MKNSAFIILRPLTLALAIVAVFSACAGGGGDNGDTGSPDVTGTPVVVDSAADMAPGHLMFIEFDGEDVIIDFTGVDSTAEFDLIVGTTSSIEPSNFLISDDLFSDLDKSAPLSPEGMGEFEADGEDFGPSETLSAWLRASEMEMAGSEPAPSFSTNKDLSPDASVSRGDVEDFRVLNSLNSVTEYSTVRAEARCVGSEIALFVDERVSKGQLTAGEIEEICGEFDRVAEWEFATVGESSDVNSDGLVTVLITPQVNLLGAMGGGIVGGYFYAADLYARSEMNPTSDEREILYVLAPDPEGEYGTFISRDFYFGELVPAILPHELQHAISFNQHVMIGKGQPEASWLNEGISHLIEDIAGYGSSNPARYSIFLSSPSTFSLITEGGPGIAQRGASYLFLRYLYEQAADGETFLRRLVNGIETGEENVEMAFAGSDEGFDEFSEFMARWTAAIALSSMGYGADSEYTFAAREIDPVTGNWKGAVLVGDCEDGRGTVLEGVHTNVYSGYEAPGIASSSAKYFTLTDVPEQIGLKASGVSNFGVLIRTR